MSMMKQTKKQQETQQNTHPHQMAKSRPAASPELHRPLQALHDAVGNHGVLRRVQPKLYVSESRDPYEREADRIAETIAGIQASGRPPSRSVRRSVTPLTRKDTSSRAPQLETEIKALEGKGHPLPESTRTFFESHLDHDFSQVRVHTDAKATRAINARAFAMGQDIVFAPGQYDPHTYGGRKLLAHELVHVAQNNSQQPLTNSEVQRQAGNNHNATPEIRWERENPEGRIQRVSPKHYVLWNFSVGGASLKPEFKGALNEIGKQWSRINRADTGKIVVEAHASASGTLKTNRRLSWNRGAVVKSYLWSLEADIPWDRISIVALGEAQPSLPNVSPAAMARNRRVEIKLVGADIPAPVVKQEPERRRKKSARKPSVLKDVWLGVGESHGGDLFIIGAHSAAAIVYNLGDEWPNVRWAAVNVSGYKFGLGLGGSVGAAFILANGISRATEFTSLAPGGWDFDASLGMKLKGWLSTLRGVRKVVKTLDQYKKLKYVGEQALKNRDLAKPGLHAFAVPLAGAGLHVWAGYKFGEVQLISHGVLDGK